MLNFFFVKAALFKECEEKELKPFLARYEKFLRENGTGYFVGNQVLSTITHKMFICDKNLCT